MGKPPKFHEHCRRRLVVILRTSRSLGGLPAGLPYCRTPGSGPGPEGSPRIPALARRLEAAFGAERDRWWALARQLGKEPTAELAHMPTCGTYSSDFGLMLAWSRLIGELAAEPKTTLVLCDDPWLFRHLATHPSVEAGRPPAITHRVLVLRLRGFLARLRVAARLACQCWRARATRREAATNAPWIIAYGHPASAAHVDAYFGQLMAEVPEVLRLFHTDAHAAEANRSARDGRSNSLHAWGRFGWLIGLLGARWRPSREAVSGPEGWLIRRAAAFEGSRGGSAMTRWQLRCQEAWLHAVRPHAIAWPWENHPWERVLARQARALGIATVGSQHTVVGPHLFNQSPASNWDGIESLPDIILCNGPAYRNQLNDWGIPDARLAIGGNLRLAEPASIQYDPRGPIFVALSNDRDFAAQMISALRPIAATGRQFLVKEHPMYPTAFADSDTFRRTNRQLQQQDGVAGVIYSTGAVGLEALLGGLPTIRFLPEGAVAMNILPPGIAAVSVEADDLAAAIDALSTPPRIDPATVLAPPDWQVWRSALVSE